MTPSSLLLYHFLISFLSPTNIDLPIPKKGNAKECSNYCTIPNCNLPEVTEVTQYASNCGKRSSGHGTGKGQFSFQSLRKAMTKNAQTTTQLHSTHMLMK